MLELLERERDSIIYQLQSTLQMENFTEVGFLIGKLTQIHDLIQTMKEGEGI
jgi:hypothetical protein